MAARIFLGISALLWLPYGLFCLVRPGFLAEAAGVAFTTTTGEIEVRAMYGGLQAGIGLLALLAAFRVDLERPALLMLAFLCAGLGLARLSGALASGELSQYTAIGLGFEFVTAGVASWLLAGARAGREVPANRAPTV